MISPEYAQLLARYNRWMNDKMYAASEQLSDAERKADRGAFFKSIHSTLNHLVWGDAMWLARFTKGTALERSMPTTPGNVDVHAEWDALKAARIKLDDELMIWAGSLDAVWLASDFSWYSGLTKSTRNGPAWQSVTHMFNHQTHHRGQVTTLLVQQKIDLGATDLIMLPQQSDISAA
ncbi:Conserved hypothetical protein, putative DNA damage-inducible DinB family protein [Herminiimonas arsenicoxydans]|uniref:DinB family protein n=1 Tax=Herminiimonas arsenicoxydans TaxID=204773 RepID=A4G3R8_HERAR|nr:Conserved hypothetical protein, putative DNA damage-inducible DinB family protein [Herminiimonas arsenicoxydans]